jgi:hypothetical protein
MVRFYVQWVGMRGDLFVFMFNESGWEVIGSFLCSMSRDERGFVRLDDIGGIVYNSIKTFIL